jgi:hypothetical protein
MAVALATLKRASQQLKDPTALPIEARRLSALIVSVGNDFIYIADESAARLDALDATRQARRVEDRRCVVGQVRSDVAWQTTLDSVYGNRALLDWGVHGRQHMTDEAVLANTTKTRRVNVRFLFRIRTQSSTL